MKLTDEQKADGCIEHDGGPCPVAEDTVVRVWFRDGRSLVRLPSWFIWEHDSSLLANRDQIVSYRPEPKQEV